MTLPPSHSLYRGQARRGIGEGPGHEVSEGEQYLFAAPELLAADVLARWRPWMTLDSDPDDRRRLGENLEAWSCCTVGDQVVVARLCAAGSYGPRAAYFSHGRVWERTELEGGFDPGVYLGRSEFFSRPWRDLPPEQIPPPPELSPQQVDGKTLQAEQELAVRLLAHLLQACVTGGAVCLAAPLTDFAAGGALVRVVAFTRLALPHDLKTDCRVRVYTRHPDVFVKQHGARLVVAPDDVAGQVLSARRDTVLLDRRGRRQSGPEAKPRARRYAELVCERVTAAAEGLPAFSLRMARSSRDTKTMPDASEATLRVIYDLPLLADSPTGRDGTSLLKYLRTRSIESTAGGIDWQRAVRDEEWRLVSERALFELILRDPAVLKGDEPGLQAAAEAFAARQGLRVDDHVDAVASKPSMSRLVALRERHPPLVSSHTIAAHSRDLAASDRADPRVMAEVLSAQREEGILRQRTVDELAELARLGPCLEVLARSTGAGELEPAWAMRLVESLSTRELAGPAERLLQEGLEQPVWNGVGARLLQRLGELEPRPVLAGRLQDLAARVQPAPRNLSMALHLAARLVELQMGDRFVAELGRHLEGSDSPDVRRAVAGVLLGGQVRGEPGLAAAFLLRGETGRFTASCLRQGGVRAEHREGLRSIAAAVDREMDGDPEATTRRLVRAGWWLTWRRHSSAARQEPQRFAWIWLTSDVWRPGRGLAVEATMEQWRQVMDDLRETSLGAQHVAALSEGETGRSAWPWIGGFERDQVQDLARHLADDDAIETLAGVLARDDVGSELWRAPELAEVLIRLAPHTSTLDADRLMRLDGPLRPLMKVHVAETFKRLLAESSTDPAEVVGALPDVEKAGLWRDDDVVSAVHGYLARQSTSWDLGNELCRELDRIVAVHGLKAPATGSSTPARPLISDLVERGFDKLALFVSARGVEGLRREKQAREARELLNAVRRKDLEHLRASFRGLRSEWTGHGGPDALRGLVERLDVEADRQHAAPADLDVADVMATLPADLFGSSGNRIPVIDLLLLLLGNRSLGEVVVAVALREGCRERGEQRWWSSLLRTMTSLPRRTSRSPLASPSLRPALARALLDRRRSELPPAAVEALDDTMQLLSSRRVS